ncbi:uncharacterized protein LOC113312842 [Papaver somniferum]|uniref:uncharacterized protein LOC113312842 n=1 Tax=Papaver somniferum TaxID=3469 RepID=UPI000E6FFA4D|nr:uncharacterized protein LOC113312842 [Papaver somniferum]
MLPEKKSGEKLEKQYDENYAKWVAFNGEWEALCWSLTEEEYYLNLGGFIAHWDTPDYPGVVSYVLRQWLEPYKERFVYAYTNQYKHLGNAMENYFKRDIDRIKEKFQKSRIFKMKGKYADNPLFKGIHYNVSRQCMKLLIIELELIDKWETKADEVCVCNMKKSMGLPCRHMIINYEHGVIPLSDIDPFCMHLSFIPPPKEEEAEEEFGDNEMGRTVLEMYRGMNKLQKQIFWDDMRKIIYLQTQENVYEPAKGKPKDVKVEAPNKDYLNEIPLYIRDYVISTDGVPPDGNYGFHVVNQQLGPFIEGAKRYNGCAITHIRQRLLSKLKENPAFYKTMLWDREGSINEEFVRYPRRLHGGHPITSDYWMSMPICGHLIADAFNCMVHYFSKHASFTFTPKTTLCVEKLKLRRCVMALVNNNHFIGLRLKPDCPLPPICATSYWPAFNADRMLGWCIMYEPNMEMWNALKKSEEIVHESQI